MPTGVLLYRQHMEKITWRFLFMYPFVKSKLFLIFIIKKHQINFGAFFASILFEILTKYIGDFL